MEAEGQGALAGITSPPWPPLASDWACFPIQRFLHETGPEQRSRRENRTVLIVLTFRVFFVFVISWGKWAEGPWGRGARRPYFTPTRRDAPTIRLASD